jgi:hypothetical protein
MELSLRIPAVSRSWVKPKNEHAARFFNHHDTGEDMKKLLLVSLLGLCACSAADVQSVFITSAPDGTRIYNYTGYTQLGENKPGDSRKYLVKVLELHCGGPAHVIRLDESPAYNAFGDFLAWSGEGRCGEK